MKIGVVYNWKHDQSHYIYSPQRVPTAGLYSHRTSRQREHHCCFLRHLRLARMFQKAPVTMVQKMTTHILLVDDDPTILDTFPVYFSTTDDLVVSGTAKTGRQALTWLEANACELVLSDIHMPDINGTELLRHIQSLKHPPLFIAMTAFDTDETMLECLSSGAVGYIVKGQAPELIIHSLRDATYGGTALSPACLSRLIASKTAGNDYDESEFRTPKINDRERAILSLLCEGKTNREIGKSLCLAEVTVRKAIANLFITFSARNRVDLAVRYQAVKVLDQGAATRLPSKRTDT